MQLKHLISSLRAIAVLFPLMTKPSLQLPKVKKIISVIGTRSHIAQAD